MVVVAAGQLRRLRFPACLGHLNYLLLRVFPWCAGVPPAGIFMSKLLASNKLCLWIEYFFVFQVFEINATR